MPADGAALVTRFLAGLSEGERAAVDAAIRAALESGSALYLVGGPVRDLIIGRPGEDVDIAVEGDVPALAELLARATGLRLVQHGRFGTATLRGDGFTIDFARTRRETYARPGALPDVEAAGIEEDLARRDFTLNAIALRLTPFEGVVLDPYGGAGDIAARLVRVLHGRSFQDDATRMLRACRYAARLAFDLEAQTAASIRRGLSYVDYVSGPRLRRELSLIFKEPSAVAAAERAAGLGVLTAIHPLLGLTSEIATIWRDALAGHHHAGVEELGFCMVSKCDTEADVTALSRRLHLTGRLESLLRDLVRLAGLSDKLERPGLTTPEAVDLLDHRAPAAVWAFGLRAGGRVRGRCLAYLREWRRMRPSLNGFDLEELGVQPGPSLGALLQRLRAARLTGEAQTRADEVAIVLREAPEARPDAARSDRRTRRDRS